MKPETGAILRLVCRYGLDSDRRTWPPPSPGLWPDVLLEINRHRLSGLAALALASGQLVLDDAQATELVDLEHQWAAHSTRMEMLALDLAARLDERKIPFVLMKGPALAHAVYEAPEMRPFGDLDPLVPAASLAASVEIVEGAGGSRRSPEVGSGFDEQWAKSVTTLTADGAEIDWHRTLFLGPLGFIVPISALWERVTTFELTGRRLSTHDPTMSFVHLAADLGVNWNSRLINRRDIYQLSEVVEPSDVAELAARCRLGAAVLRGIEVAIESLGSPSSRLLAIRASIRPRFSENAILRAYRTERRTRGLTMLAAPFAGGPRDVARYSYQVSRNVLQRRGAH